MYQKHSIRAITILTVFLLACSGGGEKSSHTAVDGKTIHCPRATENIAVDGHLDEGAWQREPCLELDDPADVADPNRVKIFTAWDNEYLYVAYEVQDKNLVGHQYERDHKALYKDDMIEVLLDPRMERTDEWLEDDIVYHINILGQVKDDRGTPGGKASDSNWRWNSEAAFAVSFGGTLNDSSDTDRGFNVELAVPWSEIGKTPGDGVRLGINFAAGDAEGPDEHLWDWCGARPYRQPTVYGTLVLEDG